MNQTEIKLHPSALSAPMQAGLMQAIAIDAWPTFCKLFQDGATEAKVTGVSVVPVSYLFNEGAQRNLRVTVVLSGRICNNEMGSAEPPDGYFIMNLSEKISGSQPSGSYLELGKPFSFTSQWNQMGVCSYAQRFYVDFSGTISLE